MGDTSYSSEEKVDRVDKASGVATYGLPGLGPYETYVCPDEMLQKDVAGDKLHFLWIVKRNNQDFKRTYKLICNWTFCLKSDYINTLKIRWLRVGSD